MLLRQRLQKREPRALLVVLVGLLMLLVYWSGVRQRRSAVAALGHLDGRGIDIDDDDDNDDEDRPRKKAKEQQQQEVTRVHPAECLVPGSSVSGMVPLRKPLEVVDGTTTVACPERGGKNTQCGKAFAEYRFRPGEVGDYFLYVEVLAPTLNDNSLWISLVEGGADGPTFDACKNPEGEDSGPLVPHKHVTGGKWLCCPAYLAKNKKKGLAAFYSDCCFGGLGKDSNQIGCVLDLEVDASPRWNEVPRIFRTTSKDAIVVVRVFAREDGTSWTRLVLSKESRLTSKDVNKRAKCK